MSPGVWSTRLRACTILLCVACGLPAWAQAPQPDAIQADNIWASFPKVEAAQPFLDFSDAWPARVGEGDVRGICIDIPGPTFRPSGGRTWINPDPLPAREVPDAATLFERFQVPLDARVRLEGDRAFIVGVRKVPEGPPPPRRVANLAELTFTFVSARKSAQAAQPLYLLDHTVFTYFGPTQGAKPDPKTPRAVILLMPGLLATPEGTLMGLTDQFRARGYGVLRMVAQPARFVEHATINVDPANPEASTGAINELFTQRLAECAFAAQAAWQHLEAARPELKPLPHAIVGFSAGAITLPTVAALEPGRYNAAVLVGGGAHFWQMQELSNYRSMIDALDLSWTSPPTPGALQTLRDAYARGVPLDPLHTAKALQGTPALVIQADADLAVPSPLGDCLWERLGKPERWLEPGGHEDLFIHLPSKFKRIADWLDAALPQPAQPPKSTPTSTPSP